MILGGGRAVPVNYARKDSSPNPLTPTYFQSIRVFPTPFTDRLTVEMTPPHAGHLSAQLFNMRGQLLRRWLPQAYESGSGFVELPLGNLDLPAGSYLLRITDERGEVESRVVIKSD